jgi:MFS family permease
VPVLLAALGALVVSLDSTVNIAFPAMSAAFAADPTAIRWVIICYVLTYAVTSFVAGLLADRFGPARVFTTGLWLSSATFLAYLAVPSFAGVLAARVAQGVGGGLVYGSAPALVTLSLPRSQHGRGLGVMSVGLGAGLAVGPLIGGLLVAAFGWRAVFVFRAPVAAAVALVSSLRLVLMSGAGRRWRLPALPEVFRAQVLSALALVFIANWAQFAVWLLMPFFLVEVLGLSPIEGGMVFMLTPLGTALAAPLGGWLTDHAGRRTPMAAGLAVEAAGLYAISQATAETPMVALAGALALVGVGLGIFQVPNLAQVMVAFPDARQGAAGGLAFMVRTLGVVVGVQATSALFGASREAVGFVAAFERAFAGAAIVCALGALLALFSLASPGGRRP